MIVGREVGGNNAFRDAKNQKVLNAARAVREMKAMNGNS
jgi:hypothetical protein